MKLDESCCIAHDEDGRDDDAREQPIDRETDDGANTWSVLRWDHCWDLVHQDGMDWVQTSEQDS